MRLKNVVILLLSIFILSGCKQTHDYQYLMEHPEVLQKEYEQCRREAGSCDEVVRAAEDFRAFILQRSENPEFMGQQIMQAQQKGGFQRVHVLYAVVRATSPE